MQLPTLPLATRAWLTFASLTAKAPEPDGIGKASLADHFAYTHAVTAVRQASSSPAFPDCPNPTVSTPDGYKYRKTPVDAWAMRVGAHHTLDLDMLVRSFVVASESVDVVKYPQYAIAISECVANYCAKVGKTAAQVCLGGTKAPGHFGQQSGRWCATSQWPRTKHVVAAEYTDVYGDGCMLWVDGRVMDKGWQGGRELAYNAETIVQKRAREGWEHVPSPTYAGVKSMDDYVLIRFAWRGVGKASAEPGLASVRDGRARWGIRAK